MLLNAKIKLLKMLTKKIAFSGIIQALYTFLTQKKIKMNILTSDNFNCNS